MPRASDASAPRIRSVAGSPACFVRTAGDRSHPCELVRGSGDVQATDNVSAAATGLGAPIRVTFGPGSGMALRVSTTTLAACWRRS